MRHTHKTWLILGVFLLLGAVSTFGQNSLTDNPNYRKALDLQRMAKQYYDSGDYQKSMEYSQQAEGLSKVALASRKNSACGGWRTATRIEPPSASRSERRTTR